MAARLATLPVVVFLAALLSVPGCSPGVEERSEFESPDPPAAPAPADLSTPESAAMSYLEWTSYAYRTADSDVASHTMTPSESVRVDAYIEFNRQQDRAIEQELTRFAAPPTSLEETRAVVVASEDWRYRYITLSSGFYDGPAREVSYDATYTLVLDGDTWLVDLVEATPLTPLE
jgi:hypothetical protein